LNALHASVYAAAFVSCLFLLLVIRRVPAERRRRATYLFALLSLLSLNFAFEWLMVNPATPAKSLWLAMIMGLALFLGPCLWLYARSVTGEAAVSEVPRIRDLSRWHFLPIASGLALLLPLLGKVHLGPDFLHPDTVVPPTQPTLVHTTMLASILIFLVQAALYLRLSVRLLVRQAQAARALFSDLQDRELNALRVLVVIVGAHWAFGIARTLHCLLLGKDAGYVVLFAICEVMFTLWAVISLMRDGAPVDPDDRRLANEIGEAKYARSALDDAARERIRRKLADAWSVHRHHLDSRLTLRSLCLQLRENPHYVSQVINQDLGTSFYDLVNRQRIAEAQRALRADRDRTVLEIALAVGFNSKSTFNSAFRQHTGQTPTEFRRNAAGEPLTDAPGLSDDLDRDATTPRSRVRVARAPAQSRTAGPTAG
jgi:AraC-like DNA-binding protein